MNYLVTGYTSGIGKAVADMLREAGHAVTRAGRGEDSDVLGFDIGFEPSKLSNRLARLGPFDGVFHAAGSEVNRPLGITYDDHWNAAMAPLGSAFAILRAVGGIRTFCTDGASIVLMSSVAAHRGTPGMGPYGAARAGVEALARTAALELAPRRIRVNCIAAGAVATPMHQRIVNRMSPATVAKYQQAHPLGFGKAESVRDAALFLLMDVSSWVTGTTMVVDGGYLA